MSALFDPLFVRLADAWSGSAPLSPLEAGLLLTFGVVSVLLLVCAGLLLSVWRRSRHTGEEVQQALAPQIDSLVEQQVRADTVLREEFSRNRDEFARDTKYLREEVGNNVRGVGENVEKRLDVVRESIDRRLLGLQEENQKKLEQMRATVDEKLQGTLEKRLGEAFQQVSHRLEAVHKGLGEMQTLAVGVGDLKKVLTNVKTRGSFGETQLETLLDQTLAPTQWQSQLQVKPRSQERVDFGVRMPGAEGQHGEPVWLPIDAKFPQEDYLRLVDAHQRGDFEAEGEAARALTQRIKQQARSIRDKYINVPTTTEFAVMFLPTEGLFAEVLRADGLAEELQRDMRVTVAGPTTLMALLNALQMGFRTLALQEQSAEVNKVLEAVKTEFGKFGGILDAVDKKLQAASNEIGKASSKSRNIEKRLKRFEELPAAEAEARLAIEE